MSLASELEQACNLACLGVDDVEHAVLALEEHPNLRVVVADDDLGYGRRSGFELLEIVGARWPDRRRLLISGLTTGDLVARAHRAGFDAIDKELPDLIVQAICALAKT